MTKEQMETAREKAIGAKERIRDAQLLIEGAAECIEGEPMESRLMSIWNDLETLWFDLNKQLINMQEAAG